MSRVDHLIFISLLEVYIKLTYWSDVAVADFSCDFGEGYPCAALYVCFNSDIGCNQHELRGQLRVSVLKHIASQRRKHLE